VSKKVDALSNKVDAVLASLVVELLKFFHKPTKQSVSVLEICRRYNPLLQEANTGNIFAKVDPVLFWENVSKKSRAETKKVNLKFPCLVPGIDLLGRISRCASKRGWNEWSRHCDSFSVRLPDFANQYSPVPKLQPVRWINLNSATPETQEQIRIIEIDQVHDIQGKYIRNAQTLL
jgi:hypothetical protein